MTLLSWVVFPVSLITGATCRLEPGQRLGTKLVWTGWGARCQVPGMGSAIWGTLRRVGPPTLARTEDNWKLVLCHWPGLRTIWPLNHCPGTRTTWHCPITTALTRTEDNLAWAQSPLARTYDKLAFAPLPLAKTDDNPKFCSSPPARK